MRKYFWCGAILMVAAAVAVYAAAIYTGRHPDFLLGALKQVAALAGKRAGPRHPAPQMPGDVDSTGEESEIKELQPEELCLPDQLDPVEGMRCLPGTQEPSTEPTINSFGSAVEPTPVLPATDPTALLHILPQAAPGLIDLEDNCPSVMPRCRDEESSPPPVMPRAWDDDGRSLQLYFGDLRSPRAGASKCTKGDSCQESGSAKCPHCTGQRKGTGKECCPSAKDGTSNGEEQEQGSKKGSMLPPELLQKHLDSLLQPYKPCETCPSARKVDTLDFRPSDARKGEFDPIPF
jgi:hypothetical protein